MPRHTIMNYLSQKDQPLLEIVGFDLGKKVMT